MWDTERGKGNRPRCLTRIPLMARWTCTILSGWHMLFDSGHRYRSLISLSSYNWLISAQVTHNRKQVRSVPIELSVKTSLIFNVSMTTGTPSEAAMAIFRQSELGTPDWFRKYVIMWMCDSRSQFSSSQYLREPFSFLCISKWQQNTKFFNKFNRINVSPIVSRCRLTHTVSTIHR